MSKAIGIDLGTTYSCVGVWNNNNVEIIANDQGTRTTPSYVAFTDSERLIGNSAKNQVSMNPENTVFDAKRLIGRKFDDNVVQRDMVHWPFNVKKGNSGKPLLEVKYKNELKTFTPEEISGMVLTKMKSIAESFLGEEVTKAVITVPAYFNDSQRQATKDAGTIAGLDVLRIINEPTASSLAYGLDKEKDEVVAVFDLGGGTFDISILEIGEGTFQVRSTAGDTHLGGDDFDTVIVDWMKDEFNKQEGIDLGQDRSAAQRLREAAERAKQELSTVAQTELNLPFVTADASGPKHLTMTLTRSKLEQLVEQLVARTEGPCLQALEDAGLTSDKIDEVILVGGQSRMPRIQEKVKEIFGKEPNRTVNPDEAVSLGAAIQAGVLTGDVQEVLLLDVTPLTLGIETLGGVSTSIIPRNTTIPTAKSQVFSTAADGQTSVEIHVLQGERAMSTDNKSLGRFILDGIAPSPRGLPQIEVTFDIDANGILNVSAVDKATSREQKIVIQAGSGLTPEEIEQMAQDAEMHATEDAEKRANIEVRNQADSASFAAEKTLEEHAEHVSDDLKIQIEEKVKEIREGLAGDIPAETLSTLTQELSTLLQTIGEAVYQSTAEDGTESNPSEGDDGEPEVVEGEFKEV